LGLGGTIAVTGSGRQKSVATPLIMNEIL